MSALSDIALVRIQGQNQAVSVLSVSGSVRIASLHVYPVKSAAGIELERAALTSAGIAEDRRWMLVGPSGVFLTQRELPRLALLRPSLSETELRLSAPGTLPIAVPLAHMGERRRVRVWHHDCEAFDEGPLVAQWLGCFLGRDCRLVRFDPMHRRLSAREWTGDVEAENRFSDGFPLLAVSSASLADLNARLVQPLPMNRFRPNIVLEGLNAFDEDRIEELRAGDIRLQFAKPCTRCAITTTNQDTGSVEGAEPLRTLKTYRYDAGLRGVCFGQNVIVRSGVGAQLARGQALQLRWKPLPAP
jgi:uncharacterized protein YcbX